MQKTVPNGHPQCNITKPKYIENKNKYNETISFHFIKLNTIYY